MTTILQKKQVRITNQLAGIMQDIADLIETHQDTTKVAALQIKMERYEQQFPMTVNNIEKNTGLGRIWQAVKIACGPFHGTARR